MGWLSFRRIIDVPVENCVAALENQQRSGPPTDAPIGRSFLRGPVQHDRDSGTYSIEVSLDRGPLRRLLPMRLHLDHWSGPTARTALELIPDVRVRPSTAYFHAGHLLLDVLSRMLIRPAGSSQQCARRQSGDADRNAEDNLDTGLGPGTLMEAVHLQRGARHSRDA